VEPYTVEKRAAWFSIFAASGRYRLLVAESNGLIAGYAGTTPFRPKAAYETSVETTIYCAPESMGSGIGSKLYAALFESIRDEEIHRVLGGITQPNEPSMALHRRFGFRQVALFTENGRKFGRYWDVVWLEQEL